MLKFNIIYLFSFLLISCLPLEAKTHELVFYGNKLMVSQSSIKELRMKPATFDASVIKVFPDFKNKKTQKKDLVAKLKKKKAEQALMLSSFIQKVFDRVKTADDEASPAMLKLDISDHLSDTSFKEFTNSFGPKVKDLKAEFEKAKSLSTAQSVVNVLMASLK